MKKSSKKFIFAFLCVSLILIGFMILNYKLSENTGSKSFELRKFKSMDEFMSFIKMNTKSIPVFWIQSPRVDLNLPTQTAMELTHSNTNVQVEGVDEGDIVKTDGNYIYMISNNSVVIAESYPPLNAKVLSKINLEVSNYFWHYWFGYDMYELYVYQNKLVVIVNPQTQIMLVTSTMPSNYTYFQPSYQTKVYVYDIEDKSNPKLEWKLTVEGRYLGSRMINNELYLITLNDLIEPISLPKIYSNNETKQIQADDIYYSPIFDNYFQICLVLRFNIIDKNLMYDAFLLGSSNVLYVSLSNIYITQVYFSEREITFSNINTHSTLGFHSVFTSPPNFSSQSISPVTQTLSPITITSLPVTIYQAITVIHRINITNLKYEAVGEVNGWLLNQFSMDEYNGYFRIATTSQHFNEQSGTFTTSNNVYVLNMNLEIIGKIDGIALDERIYAARFIKDKLYLVTFRQIDPFFVIDLSNPYKPEILGYLKIPGFSTYLHPYKEYIIGIGLNNNKLKISLFDIKDYKNPMETSSLTIGSNITYSEALHNYKAFLLDEERGLLVIPIYEIKFVPLNCTQNIDNESSGYCNIMKYTISQYALVIKINEGKLEIIGKITHLKNPIVEEDLENYKYFIRRSLYIENYLYTISNSKIKINEINSLKEVKEIDL